MATIRGAGSINENHLFKYTWPGLTNGDVGTGIQAHAFADKTVQAVGTFGTGGAVALEGSNDGGTTWATLKDHTGTAISLTASAPIALIAENPELVRPSVAGDASTALDVILVAVRGK